MKKTIRTALAGLLLVPALALGVSTVVPAVETAAQGVNIEDSRTSTRGDGAPTELTGSDGIVTTIINILLFIIGIIAVVMLIIGGIRYAVSGGDSGAVTSAKNTILYAIVGLVIAVFAYAIVNWVLDEILA